MVSLIENLITLAIDEDPGPSTFLRGLRDLVRDDKLDRASVEALIGFPDEAARQGAYLWCVQSALRDHALTQDELFALRQLRRALGIEDGELLASQQDFVTRIVRDVFLLLLLDEVIDEEEALYKVAVQESLALGYDDFLALGGKPLHEALLGLLSRMDPNSEGLTDSQFALYDHKATHLLTLFELADDPSSGGSTRTRHIPQHVKDAVWRRDGGRCVSCESDELLEFDHIIPFSRGGANTYRNVQLLCEPCNRRKSDEIG